MRPIASRVLLLWVLLAGSARAVVPADWGEVALPISESPVSSSPLAGSATGSCCNTVTETCQEDVLDSGCTASGEVWSTSLECCEVECRSPLGPEFDSDGVSLLARVSIADFQSFVFPNIGPHSANESWGYVSPRGRQYAIIGFTTGTGIVEITDPMNPAIVAYIDGEGIDVAWRDMATYREYLYIVTDGGGVGLQIVDLSGIDSGTVTHVATTDLGHGFIDAHNVIVNEESGHLYTAIPNSPTPDGLSMYSLADPAGPVLVGTWTDGGGVRCHDAQVVTYKSGPNAGREIALCLAEDDGLKIGDVSDKSNPFTLSTLVYPALQYAHQGWLSEDREYFFFGDELDERFGTVDRTTTYIVDVGDLSNPTMATTLFHDGCWIDHNMMVRGVRLYQAQYAAGLRVADVTDPQNPSEVGYFDTRPVDNQQGFPGAWGVFARYQSRVITLSDRQRGLFVLLDEPDRPVAHILSDVATAAPGVPVTFTGGGPLSIPEASAVTGWEWDFDFDGVTFDVDAGGQQVQRAYFDFGFHTVALRVTDTEGDQDVATHKVLIDGSVPTVSQWGVAALTVSLLCAGTVVLRGRPVGGG